MLRIFVVEEELHKTSNLLDELRAQLVQSVAMSSTPETPSSSTESPKWLLVQGESRRDQTGAKAASAGRYWHLAAPRGTRTDH